MIASFLGTNAFAVTGDRTAEFSPGVRVLADCGADGARYGTVAAALYAIEADRTTVTLTLDADGLTAALTAVLHGNDIPASLANHGHTGPADGGSVAHGALAGVGANSHAAIDAFLASKAAASGLATLDAASRVVQDPANATATPGATKLVMSDAAGTVDAWVSDAATSGKGKVRLATVAETQAGACADKAVTPAGLAGTAKGFIAADTTLHVSTTGSDATGDGSPNAPFASIARALASIRNKLIASGVTVTIQAADGTYTVSDTIVVDHPDADKIQILGNTSAETTVAIAAIDTTAKTITVAGDYAASIQAGDIVGLLGSGTSGLNGGYVVSDRTSDGGNTVITCSNETFASAAVGGGSIVIKPCNRCRLVFPAGVHGLKFRTAVKFGLLDGFRVENAGNSAYAISADTTSACTIGSKNIVMNWMCGVFSGNASYVEATSCMIKNCTFGAYADTFSRISLRASCCLDGGATAVTVNKVSSAFVEATLIRGASLDYSPAIGTLGNGNSYIAA